MKTVYKGKERMKNCALRVVLGILRDVFPDKAHPHTRENARRMKQIEKGILKINEEKI